MGRFSQRVLNGVARSRSSDRDGRILSTDVRDLHAYRWKNRKPFRNLIVL